MADWYYAPNGAQIGPVAIADLQSLAAQGQLAGSDLVWTEGMAQWQPASAVAGLLPEFIAAPTAPYPPYVQPYATPVGNPVWNTAPSQHANLALTGMVLSLVSLVVGGPLLAIPGAICGWIAMKGMRLTGNFQNRGYALTAIWIGVAWTVLLVLIIALLVTVFAMRH